MTTKHSAPSGRTGVGLLVVMLIACLLMDTAAFFMLKGISAELGVQDQGRDLAQWITVFEELYWTIFIPASILFFGLLTLLVWLIARRTGARKPLPAGLPKVKSPAQSAEARTDPDQRLFLHLLTVLQREGRMVDFFYEDLAAYSDAQIGTAVRSIHENCRKVMDKYLAPEAVVRENEGDEITVPEGFDAGAVKLTGNVIGEPPFKGTVRHRGWRARKLNLPTLSEGPDPAIIAPAEVEVH